MRRPLFLLMIAVMILGCLAAAPAEAAQTLRVMLDWYKNPNHAPILLAQARGDYAKAGLDVSILEPADPNDPPKLVAAGAADIAISYQPQTMILIDKGLPIVRIGALISKPLNSVMVLESGPVKSLSDLKGRTVGYSVSGFEDALLATMLNDAGLKLSDVKLVNVNFALVTSLLSRQTDAVIGAFRNYEAHQIGLKGQRVRIFPVEAHGVPTYEELIFVAQREKANDPRIATFLSVTAQAAADIARAPDDMWRVLTKADPAFDNALNAKAYGDTAPLFSTNTAPADAKAFEAFSQFMKNQGLTKTQILISRYQK